MSIEHYVGTETLVVVKCWCGTRHAVPKSLRKEQLRRHDEGESPMSVYCPLGHSHVPSGTPKHELIEQQLQRERARHDQTRAELRTTEARRRATKAAHTRTKRRVGNGVCPCCNRTFQNLQRHMESQHPEYADSEATHE